MKIGMRKSNKFIEIFWSHVDKGDPDKCWLWTAFCMKNGYGKVHYNKKISPLLAHRVSAWLAGQDVIGKVVRHKCDNPPCVNPAHLITGTHSQNSRDMYTRGRGHNRNWAKGTRCHLSKLTEETVLKIRSDRASGEIMTTIAKRYGICKQNVSEICSRHTWKHI